MISPVEFLQPFFKNEKDAPFPFASLSPIFIQQISHYLADLERSSEEVAELCVDVRRDAKLNGLSPAQYMQYLNRIEEQRHSRDLS